MKLTAVESDKRGHVIAVGGEAMMGYINYFCFSTFHNDVNLRNQSYGIFNDTDCLGAKLLIIFGFQTIIGYNCVI